MRKNYGFFAGSPSDGRFLSCQRSRTVRVSGSKRAFSPEKRRSISPLPTISLHLHKLADRGVLRSRIVGTRTYYALRSSQIAALVASIRINYLN